MSDFADDASEQEEMERELSIAFHRKKTHGLLPVGSCHFCNSQVASTLLFCDGDCRDDWEREQQARIRNGS